MEASGYALANAARAPDETARLSRLSAASIARSPVGTQGPKWRPYSAAALRPVSSAVCPVPLCGTPDSGQFAGKQLCTVHLPDGTAILAGAGLVVYGLWEASGGQVCRRAAQDPVDRRRCVTYERVDRSHFRNSDGVGFCLGPCENDKQ